MNSTNEIKAKMHEKVVKMPLVYAKMHDNFTDIFTINTYVDISSEKVMIINLFRLTNVQFHCKLVLLHCKCVIPVFLKYLTCSQPLDSEFSGISSVKK